jgi:hypothetical protein
MVTTKRRRQRLNENGRLEFRLTSIDVFPFVALGILLFRYYPANTFRDKTRQPEKKRAFADASKVANLKHIGKQIGEGGGDYIVGEVTLSMICNPNTVHHPDEFCEFFLAELWNTRRLLIRLRRKRLRREGADEGL